jgi:hypothetical protein
MVGVAPDERPFARTLFVVTKVNQKRAVPVTIRLNAAVTLFIDSYGRKMTFFHLMNGGEL